ncbi:MAG: class II aldolase/adducin family protein [bacterium]|nr:class II aldolase/adducin family protein [bacterium]
MNELNVKKEIIEVGRRLWTKDFVAANDGNISVKISEHEILCTPSGVSKGFMTEEMIVKIDTSGKVLRGSHRTTSEIKMHLEAYSRRTDIRAVVHSHPPYCLALAVCGISLDACLLPEVVLQLGKIPLAPYATPSTEEVPQSISELIKTHDAVLLQNHGLITIGRDLPEAYYKTETVEHFAKIYYLALATGRVNYLDTDEVEKLVSIRKLYGIREDLPGCTVCKLNKISQDDIKKIVEEVVKGYIKK